MSDKQSTRRKFMQALGLSAGAALVSKSAVAGFVNQTEIKKLNPAQQEFMKHYGAWMDEFTEAIRIQKTVPANRKNNMRMMTLTEKAEEMRPELTEFMKDPTFAVIYKVAIERTMKEI